MDIAPASLIFRGQSVKGTLVSSLAEIDETLEFARRGMRSRRTKQVLSTDMVLGKLRLEPTVVGLSKFNESVQKLKNGQVAG
jgi:propanol-preferring alcohol dehydrogenase